MSRTIVTTTCTAVSSAQPLGAHELAHACGVSIEWVVQLAQAGVVEPTPPEAEPQAWRFESAHLQRALAARRLQRDFDVDLDAAALILDLQQEVRRLRALLHTHGLGH